MSVLLAGCVSEGPTQLIVAVDTDLPIPAGLDTLRLQVSHQAQALSYSYALDPRQQPHHSLPATLALNAGSTPRSTIHVVARGLLGEREVVRREARVLGWVRGERRLLRLDLLRRCAARPVPCGVSQTCTEQGCRSAQVDPAQLPTYDKEAAFRPLRDSGSDGARADAGVPDDAGAADGGGDGPPPRVVPIVCGAGQWCWHNPRPGGTIRGLWSPDDHQTLFAVGLDALILYFDGRRWSRHAVPPSVPPHAALWDVWGTGPSDVYAVGETQMLHFDGAAWTAQSIQGGSARAITGARGPAGWEIFAVGPAGSILHFSGGNWVVQTSPVQSALRDVWARAVDDVYATGDDGVVLHYDGDRWRRLPVTPANAFVGAVTGNAFATYVTSGGVIEAISGDLSSLSRVFESGVSMHALGTRGAEIFAASQGGELLHFDSESQWARLEFSPAVPLLALSVGPTNVVCAGEGAIFVEGNSAPAQLHSEHLVVDHLHAVWGLGPERVYAAGDRGQLLHYDGNRWRKLLSAGSATLRGLWTATQSEVFAVGDETTLARFDGEAWQYERLAAAQRNVSLYDVWGTELAGQTAIYAVGDDVILQRQSDGQWVTQALAGTSNATESIALRAISGEASGAHLTAVGLAGVIVQKRGASAPWERVAAPTTQDLLDVWVESSASAIAVGRSGTILRYDGRDWTAETSGTTDDLRTVWQTPSGLLLAAGARQHILRRSPDGWVADQRPASNIAINALWGVGNTLVAVGKNGTILHSQRLRCDSVGGRAGATQTFYLDGDGDLHWSTADLQRVFSAAADVTPLSGDFNADGRDELGTHQGNTFFIDGDGNGSYDPDVDFRYGFGLGGDLPIVGDWNGDGRDAIGTYRPSASLFWLDVDGDGAWQADPDRSLAAPAALSGDLPIAGDWDGDGRDEVGLFRPSAALFILDVDGDGVDNNDPRYVFGSPGDRALVGDWNCDGRDELGVYRPVTKTAILDIDGNHRLEGDIDRQGLFDPGQQLDQVIGGRW